MFQGLKSTLPCMSEQDPPIITSISVSDIDPSRSITSQSCPDWIKITEIPHPALVPGFISRRECLPDGSLDPNTPSVPSQMILLQASTLSPSLSGVISNIPSGLMCESIHKKVLKDAKETIEGGFVITLPPSHYARISEESTVSANTMAMANQTASELATLNILYGGVKGKAYLDSLKSFIDGFDAQEGSRVEFLLRNKLEKAEGVCGFKILNPPTEFVELESETIEASNSLIRQNHQICKLLNTPLDPNQRKDLLERLRTNLDELVRECPEEIKMDKFKGVNIVI